MPATDQLAARDAVALNVVYPHQGTTWRPGEEHNVKWTVPAAVTEGPYKTGSVLFGKFGESNDRESC